MLIFNWCVKIFFESYSLSDSLVGGVTGYWLHNRQEQETFVSGTSPIGKSTQFPIR
jgi:hypothetical protein